MKSSLCEQHKGQEIFRHRSASFLASVKWNPLGIPVACVPIVSKSSSHTWRKLFSFSVLRAGKHILPYILGLYFSDDGTFTEGFC